MAFAQISQQNHVRCHLLPPLWILLGFSRENYAPDRRHTTPASRPHAQIRLFEHSFPKFRFGLGFRGDNLPFCPVSVITTPPNFLPPALPCKLSDTVIFVLMSVRWKTVFLEIYFSVWMGSFGAELHRRDDRRAIWGFSIIIVLKMTDMSVIIHFCNSHVIKYAGVVLVA